MGGRRVDFENMGPKWEVMKKGKRKLKCGGLMNVDISLFDNCGERWGRRIGLGGGNGNGFWVLVNLTLCKGGIGCISQISQGNHVLIFLPGDGLGFFQEPPPCHCHPMPVKDFEGRSSKTAATCRH